MAKLKEYRRKRKFDRTQEPAGSDDDSTSSPDGALRFVIQKHQASHLHFDLRLEMDGVLKSWAVPKGPSIKAGERRLAVEVEDHPIEYGTFEGTIPKGEYGGGTVMLWDHGMWTPAPKGRVEDGRIDFVLDGHKLQGAWSLIRTKSDGKKKSQKPQWLLIKRTDSGCKTSRLDDTSVTTGRTMDEITTGAPPHTSPSDAASEASSSNSPNSSSNSSSKASSSSSSKPSSDAPSGSSSKASSAVPSSPSSKASSDAPPSSSSDASSMGKTVEALERELSDTSAAATRAMPDQLAPALATLEAAVPKSDDWVHEIKFDGYRIITRLTSGSGSGSKAGTKSSSKTGTRAGSKAAKAASKAELKGDNTLQARLLTRNGKDWTSKLPALQQRLERLPCDDAVLDGELVAYEPGGKTNFAKLQQAFTDKSTTKLVYQVFDILYLNGRDLTKVALVERKALLQTLLTPATDAADRTLRYTDHVVGKGPAFYEQACALELEGIISKKAEGTYITGRSRSWLKIKCTGRDEFLICGYTAPQGSRTGFGALLLGAWHDQRLIYTGKVGTGFNQRNLKALTAQLKRLEVKKCPLHTDPNRTTPGLTPADLENVTWVKPKLIAAVEFSNWTREGRLRHPVFRGLRDDIEAKDVLLPVEHPSHPAFESDTTDKASSSGGTSAKSSAKTSGKGSAKAQAQNGGDKERGKGSRRAANSMPELQTVSVSEATRQRLNIAGVSLSNPQRVLYPSQGLTKSDLAVYYAEIAEWIMPYVQRRPLSLVRCPAGVTDECFFQKHPGSTISDTVPRVDLDGKRGLYIEKLTDLMQIVQVGALELHTWGSTVDNLEYPDTLVFDLDPAPDVSLNETFSLSLELRDYLTNLGLRSFPRTTGGKGLHLVVPIKPDHKWPQVKQFCRGVAVAFAHDNPKKATAQMAKSKRKGRVFIDYLRNGRGATAIASFSTRARPGAPVAVPVRWDEVTPSLRPDQYTASNLKRRLSRLQSDPWADFARIEQGIPAEAIKAMEKVK